MNRVVSATLRCKKYSVELVRFVSISHLQTEWPGLDFDGLVCGEVNCHGLGRSLCALRLQSRALRTRQDGYESARAARCGEDRARCGHRASYDALCARRSFRAVRIPERSGSLVP